MDALSPEAPSPTLAPVRALEAYVVPQLVEVNAGTDGLVTAVDVAPHDVVRRGQRVAVLELLSRSHRGGRASIDVHAPATGVVTRCWVSPGSVVAATRPLIAIARSEEVLVVARFGPEHGARLRRGAAATVLFDGCERLPGTIVRLWTAQEPDPRTTRAVVSLPAAPADALWPGTYADVEVLP